MSENHRVALKESVFRETPLTEDEFDDDLQLEFPSKDDAEAWVDERNHSHSKMGELTLHKVHPNDKSGVDAYVVFKPVTKMWVPDS